MIGFIYIAVLTLVFGLIACVSDDPLNELFPSSNPNLDINNMSIRIQIGSHTFTATLQDNATAQAFVALLPMTIQMNELNNNEKYYDLANSLPTTASNPGTIRNGDLMVYGSRTLVLFYKTFSTSYSYTRIGSVDDPSGLQSALGTERVNVTFEIAED